MKRSFALLAVWFWIIAHPAAAVAPPSPARPAVSDRAAKLEQVYQELVTHNGRLEESDVEALGAKALRETGKSRLYDLWQVLYYYQDNQGLEAFRRWIKTVRNLSRQSGDKVLADFAAFFDLAYRIDNAENTRELQEELSPFRDNADADIRAMAGLETLRNLVNLHKIADAARMSATVLPEIEQRGPRARRLMAEAEQISSYNFINAGDDVAALDHVIKAAALNRMIGRDTDDITRLYDLGLMAMNVGEYDSALKISQAHHQLTLNSKIPNIRFWDSFLCARVAEARQEYERVLQCLTPVAAQIAKPQSLAERKALQERAYAYGRLGRAGESEADLNLLRQVPASVTPRDLHTELLLEAQIDHANGHSDAAYKKLDQWRRDESELVKARNAGTVKDISSALQTELQVKRDESARLAKTVALEQGLATAWAVIAALFGVVLVGGGVWLLHQRRISRRLEDAMRQAEAANAAKSSFLTVMSHELRTPLNGMLGIAQSLRANEHNAEQRAQLDILLDSGDVLLTLLNDLLDLSKIEAGKVEILPSPGDLSDICERVAGAYRATAGQKGLTLNYAADPAVPQRLCFDAVRVRQCLANLIANAVKFTEAGHVDIRLSVAPGASSDGDGVEVILSVTDTGIGMSEQTVSKLFGAFSQADASTTRKYGGSGLGLKITRQLARLMGGDVAVTSQENVGSTFTLTFHADRTAEPADAAEGNDSDEAPITEPALNQGLRVLTVDDHPVNRKIIRLFLDPIGATITEAQDGQMALDLLDTQVFDVVLMDVNMPVLDGLEATRRLRANPALAHLPVIGLTADVMSAQVEVCKAAGMNAHIGKPIDARKLIEVMTQLLVNPPSPVLGAAPLRWVS